MQECRNVGTYINVGMQECMNVGMQECRMLGMQESKNLGIQDIMEIRDIMDIIDITDMMDMMDMMDMVVITDIMDIINKIAWMAMAGAKSALIPTTTTLALTESSIEFTQKKMLSLRLQEVSKCLFL